MVVVVRWYWSGVRSGVSARGVVVSMTWDSRGSEGAMLDRS